MNWNKVLSFPEMPLLTRILCGCSDSITDNLVVGKSERTVPDVATLFA